MFLTFESRAPPTPIGTPFSDGKHFYQQTKTEFIMNTLSKVAETAQASITLSTTKDNQNSSTPTEEQTSPSLTSMQREQQVMNCPREIEILSTPPASSGACTSLQAGDEHCKSKSASKAKGKRLTKKQEEDLKMEVYFSLTSGIPPLAIALQKGITVKKVREIMSELLLSPEGRDISESKFIVMATGHKLKEICRSGFDKCEYVRVDINDDGSVTLRPFQ